MKALKKIQFLITSQVAGGIFVFNNSYSSLYDWYQFIGIEKKQWQYQQA